MLGLGSILAQAVGGLGVMALGLAIVGLYGLVAYAASRRTREIGIRMAVGADRQSVVRMILTQGIGLAIAGLVIGLPLGLVVQQQMSGIFPAQTRWDPLPLAVVVPVLLGVTALAAYVPARRASRVDLLRTLHTD